MTPEPKLTSFGSTLIAIAAIVLHGAIFALCGAVVCVFVYPRLCVPFLEGGGVLLAACLGICLFAARYGTS
jgi:hypothetical protein